MRHGIQFLETVLKMDFTKPATKASSSKQTENMTDIGIDSARSTSTRHHAPYLKNSRAFTSRQRTILGLKIPHA